MLPDVIEVRPTGVHRLWLRFDDGVEGEIDLGPHLTFEGVFAPLEDQAYFREVSVDAELGTIHWPNGADWDPLALYALVTHRSVDELLAEGSPPRR
jgi:hypothetical protein